MLKNIFRSFNGVNNFVPNCVGHAPDFLRFSVDGFEFFEGQGVELRISQVKTAGFKVGANNRQGETIGSIHNYHFLSFIFYKNYNIFFVYCQ